MDHSLVNHLLRILIPLSLLHRSSFFSEIRNLIPFIVAYASSNRISVSNSLQRACSASLMILSHRDRGSAMDGDASATTPLSAIAEAFEDLANLVGSRKLKSDADRGQLRLDVLCHACSPIAVLFGSLGLAFKFAEIEFVSKVNNLVEASVVYGTLQSVIDSDVANQTVKTQGSNSRNLRRVRQGLALIRALFEQFLSNDDYSLKNAASAAYAQVCAPYHSWTVRTAVAAGMYALPTREQLLLKLNETNHSAEKKMRRYIRASLPVTEYIDKLYLSRNIRLDW